MSGKQAVVVPVIVGLTVSNPILLADFTLAWKSYKSQKSLLQDIDSKLLGKNTSIELVP